MISKLKLPGWSILVFSVVVAMLTASGIVKFNQLVDKQDHLSHLLDPINEKLSRLSVLEPETMIDRGIDPEFLQEIEENRQKIKTLFNELKQADAQFHRSDEVLSLFEQFNSALDEEIEFLIAGKIEQAIKIDQNKVDPIYGLLVSSINQLSQNYLEEKKQARKIADIVTILFLLLASIVIGALFWRFNAQLIAQKNSLEQALKDLQQSQDKLVQSEKLAALGQLIAGIAHEINTPLGAIKASISNINYALEKAFIELPPLLQRLSPEQLTDFFTLINLTRKPQEILSSREERQLRRTLKQTLTELGIDNAETLASTLSKMGIKDSLDPIIPLLKISDVSSLLDTAYHLSVVHNNSQTIRLAVEKAARIVFALKIYIRQDINHELVMASVSEGIDTVLILYQNQIKKGIEIIKNYENVLPILCYPEELLQVWSNLIHNAIQAMNYRGELEITVFQKEQTVVVQIKDQGTGISEEIKDKIFEPFFTTKASGEGSGLGLSIVKKIIDKHHGSIEVESMAGQTVFQVSLPAN